MFVHLMITGWGDVSTSPPAKDTFELRSEDSQLILEETRHICWKWRRLGNALKMSPVVLDTIEEDVYYMRESYNEVVRQWMKGTEPKPKWQTLISALREVKEATLAKHLRSTFTVGEQLNSTQWHGF